MREKIDFLKKRKDLESKIILLYKTILNFEKNKIDHSIVINPKNKNGKTN
jgi:hypothetical protein